MKIVVLVALAVMPDAALSLKVLAESTLSLDEAGAKKRPVSKVITLLKDMQTQMEKEAEEDEEIYDKMQCWCQTNSKEKDKAIEDAENRISDLTSKTQSLLAASARTNTEVKSAKAEVAENQAGLDKATAIRQKQLAEFNAEEKEAIQAISALKSAVITLKKHNSFLQTPRAQLAGVALSVQQQMQKHPFADMLSLEQHRAIASFLEASTDSEKASYAPQSGEIFGILKQMKETFESNLQASQNEEQGNQRSYEELKTAKEAEIKAGQQQIDTKTQEIASIDAKLSEAKEDLADTKKSLAADETFVIKLKESCKQSDAEYEERTKARNMEMEAVAKALEVLSSDDAHDLFTKTFNPSFVQKESTMKSARRAQVSALLSSAAEKAHNPRLATLAIEVRLDAFTKVKKAIDGMIADLMEEKAAEIKHKDFCVEEFNSNEQQTERKTRQNTDVDSKIEDLELNIKELKDGISGLTAEISEMQAQLKRAGEDRESENKEFKTTVADQRATQKLLTAALNILKGFYAKKAEAALFQGRADQPAGFGTHKKSASSGGVMGLIQQIIYDAKAMEAEAIRSEEDAQEAYDSFVKNTNASIKTKGKDLVNKSEQKAKAEADLVDAKKDKSAVMLELEQLANSKAQLHKSCDFVIKNFELRQTARDEEVEALKQAKAILSGAKFDAFLQDA